MRGASRRHARTGWELWWPAPFGGSPLPTWGVWTAALVASGVLAGQSWWWPLVGVAVVLLMAFWLVGLATRRLGGISGDVLGALVELSAAVLLVVATIP